MLFNIGAPRISAVSKVKAHLDPREEGVEPDERWRRLGNHAADLAAEAGANLRPAATDEEQEGLTFCIRVAKAVCKLAAKILPQWPRLDLSNCPRKAQVSPGTASSEATLTKAMLASQHSFARQASHAL
eukprot:4676855-Pyramimonas_sp.AAC.1